MVESWTKFIHDTITRRFRSPLQHFLGAFVIMRRVDVHEQQTVGIVRRQGLGPDLRDPHAVRQPRRFELAARQSLANRRQRRRGCRPRTAARSPARSAESPGPRRSRPGARATPRSETACRRPRPACARAATRRSPCRCRRARRGRGYSSRTTVSPASRGASCRGHEKDRCGNLPQHSQLAVDDGRAADRQRGLAQAAHARGAAAGEDGRGQRPQRRCRLRAELMPPRYQTSRESSREPSSRESDE